MPIPLATPVPETADPGSMVPLAMQALEAIERRDYAVGLGLVLMVLTFFAARIASSKLLVPKEFTSTILLGSAVVGGLGVALASGAPPMRAALAFLACSSTAIAFWEGIAKHLVRLWHWRRRRRRPVFTRKLTMMAIACVVMHASAAEAGEIIEPGIVLVRPDGTEVRIDSRRILLDDVDVARLGELGDELAACQRRLDDCKREAKPSKRDRMLLIVATFAGAFAASLVLKQSEAMSTEELQLP